MRLISSTLKINSIKKEILKHQNIDKILILRNRRGLGDILMCRMIFEDFHRIVPNIKIVFACPKEYHDFIKDHPYIYKVEDCNNIKMNDYKIRYDISNCCIIYESKIAPYADKHRADIWAEYCGVKLTKHNMFLNFVPNDLILESQKELNLLSNKKKVLFCPYAYDNLRSLNNEQIIGVVNYLKTQNCFIYTTHTKNIELLSELGVKVFYNLDNYKWLSYIHVADCVITVDTSVFHYAGGIKKPMVGIFTHVDGKCRGKYFNFELVQKHRDNGNWPCGPCYNYSQCTHKNCTNKDYFTPKPCITELTVKEIITGINNLWEI